MTLIAAVRVRGKVNVNCTIRDTMKFLRLNRVNHCVLIPDTPQYMGMLKKAKDYITWGEAAPKTVRDLLVKRGRKIGDAPITPKYIRDVAEFKDINELTKAICSGKVIYKSLPEIKPLFRLAPPRKGYEGIKRSYSEGGTLGYRGKNINELIGRMM